MRRSMKAIRLLYITLLFLEASGDLVFVTNNIRLLTSFQPESEGAVKVFLC